MVPIKSINRRGRSTDVMYVSCSVAKFLEASLSGVFVKTIKVPKDGQPSGRFVGKTLDTGGREVHNALDIHQHLPPRALDVLASCGQSAKNQILRFFGMTHDVRPAAEVCPHILMVGADVSAETDPPAHGGSLFKEDAADSRESGHFFVAANSIGRLSL